MVSLTIAQDPAADRVLSEDPFALLVGMLLDQQFPMERAFAGPAKVLERFGTLDPRGSRPTHAAGSCTDDPCARSRTDLEPPRCSYLLYRAAGAG